MEWEALILTFKLAALTTIILLMAGLPIAYWLHQTKSILKPVFETLISMPLVLPPTVLGFYLLLAFSPNNALGAFLDQWFDIQLVFSFSGLVVASVVYSLPFMVHPLISGFKSIPTNLIEASQMLGKSNGNTLWHVQLPNMKPAILSGIVLSFAHTIGEFGVVLMIGGNIPGETKVASIAIYDAVESMSYMEAHQLSFMLFAISFALLIAVYTINKKHTNLLGK